MKVRLFLFWILFASLNSMAMIRYAAPVKQGNGNGMSVENAADFLNAGFWIEVQKTLRKEPVIVKFMSGDYARAYTEKPFILEEMGNKKNALTLEGDGQNTLFTVPVGYKQQSVLMAVKNSQNIIIRNFNFTGSGKLGYALQITSGKDNTTENILVDNCTWTDMRGIIYGATGVHQQGTSSVTYKDCSFKRVGIDSHSHFMYHAHYASNIHVVGCYFEDCTGDYVRFRDHCDYGDVENSTFVRTEKFPVYPFISVPLFNNIDPGDETFATHYTFTGNHFKNTKNAIAFHHYGFDPVGKHYLLTAAEGEILVNGTPEEKKRLLRQNFDVNTDDIKISNNTNVDITHTVVMGSFPKYGAQFKGWSGWGDISIFFN
ncbi:right-handed parallel beta-helix repeat-containing protein [Pedobacter sp. BS3]|uniref:right-handed parallel beta-helix repeat-containing protein n=1 Tax=Pedobacter sp. BS3 TaxID=2567937 RepID=UPI0011EF0829|nr:right-handed parallel beta-helix repeat-containing protein [Pedobacter sp. BS3]TZF81439.1 right-handed parallel beta-helix repeat-containing protein [Pedobacter sp. BS3]